MYSARSILKYAKESVEITIINKTNYFLFTPMLHEVATGGLGHHQVVESIREIIYKTNVHFLEATIFSVDVEKKEVITDHGNKPYDMLVLALGATTNFFNTPGAEKYCMTLKNLSDAIAIRSHVVERFESASREKDPEVRKKMLTFVVVGGGATGVELATELAELTKYTLNKYYRNVFSKDCAKIVLVHSGKELLGPFPEKVRSYAEKILAKDGIKLMMNTKVVDVGEGYVALGSGERIEANTIIWTAGVRANTVHTTGGEFPKDESGRIVADATLVVPGFSGVFALGDMACVPGEDGKPYPMLAQIAVAEADLLGKNIHNALAGEELESFAFRNKGLLVSLGRWQAAGTVFGVYVYGKLAWFIWRTVYLFKFISNSKKFKIALDWTIHLFTSRDVTRT